MHWYPINTLTVDGIPVLFRLGQGTLHGILKVSRKGHMDYRVRDPNTRKYISLPEWSTPWCWRPASIADWPFSLPEPIIEQRPPEPKRVAVEAEIEVDPIDAALNPKFRLGGFSERPETREESESRFLRALLTDRYMEDTQPGAAHATRSTCADWPRDFVIGAKLIEKRLRSSKDGRLESLRPDDYLDFHIDRSELEARTPRWEPDRRDIGDWENGVLRWGDHLSRVEWRIIRHRCARWSYRAIGERLAISHEAVRRRYGRAIDKIWLASRK